MKSYHYFLDKCQSHPNNTWDGHIADDKNHYFWYVYPFAHAAPIKYYIKKPVLKSVERILKEILLAPLVSIIVLGVWQFGLETRAKKLLRKYMEKNSSEDSVIFIDPR